MLDFPLHHRGRWTSGRSTVDGDAPRGSATDGAAEDLDTDGAVEAPDAHGHAPRAGTATGDDGLRCDGGTVVQREEGAPRTGDAQISVLNLVTNEQARFYQQQVEQLEARGVACTTVAVPDQHEPDASRSVLEYLRILPPTVLKSFGEYDVVHANNGLTVPAALLQPNLPVVASLWGSDVMGTYGPITRQCVKLCDEVVVMSEEMATYLDGDPTVIPHGVDLERFTPMDRSAARDELGWDDDAAHLFFPYDTARPVKDFPRARRIAERAKRRLDVPVELQTVSGVPHERMPLYYNAADALLLTSKREGSPNSVKEAMACNTPVVATAVGDVPERLDGVSASVASDEDRDLVDAVVAVVEGDARSDAREHAAANVGLDAMSDRLYEVYEDVLDLD